MGLTSGGTCIYDRSQWAGQGDQRGGCNAPQVRDDGMACPMAVVMATARSAHGRDVFWRERMQYLLMDLGDRVRGNQF